MATADVASAYNRLPVTQYGSSPSHDVVDEVVATLGLPEQQNPSRNCTLALRTHKKLTKYFALNFPSTRRAMGLVSAGGLEPDRV